MLNDRSDRHDEHEESEYHFSDDDVSYEVEPETAKSISAEPSENIFNRLTRSKRMIISLVVFLGLVFVVYKMVAPNTSVPVGEITPPVVSANQAGNQQPSAPMSQTAAQSQQPMAAMPANQMASAPEAASPAVMPSTPAPAPVSAPAMPAQAEPAPIQSSLPPGAMPQAPAAQQPGQQPVVGMPSVIPVESSVTTYPAQPAPSSVGMPITQVSANAASLEIATEKAISQMQADYTQKLNEYAAQNRSVQDQMQTLSVRVANMESQINQLVQTLTKQNQAANQPAALDAAARAPVAPTPAVEPKVSYSVQAIIPGRAWLKSDSGDTVTVAEGDVIKDLGRVTKIDPYDGIVEVNTGSRTVSISYGNGG